MADYEVYYQGKYAAECVHLKNHSIINTEAPIENHGKGKLFSPTDLFATSLASCMLIIMGIKASSLNVKLEGTYARVSKKMASQPRRIVSVKVEVHGPEVSEEEKKVLEKAAMECPVYHSLHPDIEKQVTFQWG